MPETTNTTPIACNCPCHDGLELLCNCCERKGETRPAQGNDEERAPAVLNAPPRIYLNVGELLRDTEFKELQRDGQVSWWVEKFYAADIEYVRADLAAPAAQLSGNSGQFVQPPAPAAQGEAEAWIAQSELDAIRKSGGVAVFVGGQRDEYKQRTIPLYTTPQPSAPGDLHRAATAYFQRFGWPDPDDSRELIALAAATLGAQPSADDAPRQAVHENHSCTLPEFESLVRDALNHYSLPDFRTYVQSGEVRYVDENLNRMREVVNAALSRSPAAAPPADARDAERIKFIAERLTEMTVEEDHEGRLYTINFTNHGARPDGAWVSSEKSVVDCIDMALAGRMGENGCNELLPAWPECSGDPACCPENEGYGCCKPNPADRAMGGES